MREEYYYGIFRSKHNMGAGRRRAGLLPTAHDLARVKICGKGFGIETRHGEKGRNTIDLGLAEIPDIRERDG